jgi:sugar phosphate permease
MPSKTRPTVTDTLSVDIDGDAAVQHHETSDHTATATAKAWPQRFTIIALCFLAFMLCNMDRVNMSIAVLPMQQQYGWNSQTLGIVQSSFFWCASKLSSHSELTASLKDEAGAQICHHL